MKRKHPPYREFIGNFASILGSPVSEKHHPTIILKPIKKFPYIKPMRWER